MARCGPFDTDTRTSAERRASIDAQFKRDLRIRKYVARGWLCAVLLVGVYAGGGDVLIVLVSSALIGVTIWAVMVLVSD